jgi:glutaminase
MAVSMDPRVDSEEEYEEDLYHHPFDSNPDDILRELFLHVVRRHESDSSSSDDDEDINSPNNHLRIQHVVHCLLQEGIWFWRDERFVESQNVALRLANTQRKPYTQQISPESQTKAMQVPLNFYIFQEFVKPCARLFLKAFSQELVIPNWKTFVTDMKYHFQQVDPLQQGENASYIPILKTADPEKWALSICSIDGQRVSLGHDQAYLFPHTLQSVSKPVTYAMALHREGEAFMEEWIDVEPAGRPFNTQDLDPETQRPFNASINSGAIMAAGILASGFPPTANWKDIVDNVRKSWYELCGNDLDIGFSDITFESEKETAYNNFAIAYNLKGRKGLPRNVDLHTMLDVYLGCCSIEITTEALSVAAATLANGGICPITGKEVFPASVVRAVLSEIMMCGMYNQAGHFAVEVGLPAKSGVSGALMVIVPNVFGFATFSPRLNTKGNSVRGVAFCRRLVDSYRVHVFETLRSGNTGAKIDPRRNGWKEERKHISRMAWAVQVGDVHALRIRDIFLFALCQTAIASPEGLSERMLDLIRASYQDIYQSPVDESLLSDIQEAVKQNPKELHFLDQLTKDTRIQDSMRTLIVMAMFDIIMVDGYATEEEQNVAIQVATLLGVSEKIARMELNRYKQKNKHRSRDMVYCDMIESYDVDVSRHRQNNPFIAELYATSASPSRNQSFATLREELLKQKRVPDKLPSRENLAQQEEIVALRKEVLRLRQKLSNLTLILNDRMSAVDID